MTQKPSEDPPAGDKTLRQRAEQMLHTKRTKVSDMGAEQVQRLVHELQVHEIELQMQNEALQRAQQNLALEWEIQAKREKLLFENTVRSVPDALILTSLDRQITFCNEGFESVFGYSAQELVGRPVSILYKDPEEYLRQSVVRFDAAIGACFDPAEIEFQRSNGQCFVGELRGTVLRGIDGQPQGYLGLVRDLSIRKKLEADQRRYNQVLEAIASGASLADILQLVIELTQESLPGSLGAILVLDQSSRRLHLGHAAALPPELVKAIDGLHTDIDRCGCTQAAATGQRVVIEDIAASSVLDNYGRLARASGLQACWCQPILATNEEILGTLTLYFAQPRTPSSSELGLLEHAAQMSGIAIERASANERVRISEERLQLVTQASTDAIWDYNLVDGTVWWNTAYIELFGRTADANTADWWVSRIHPDDRQRISQSLRAFAAGEGDSERWTAEYRFQRADGDFAYVIDRALRSRDACGKTVRIVGSLYDLTERRELEKQVLEIVIHERRRIGSDLHDGLGQELTGLSMVADSLITALSRKSLPEERLAQKLNVGLQRALAQTRSLARGLNPVDIDARGLMVALEEMASRIRDSYEVECLFHCEQEMLFRENRTATQLFRIAQEATTNALRHGQANHITITLASLGDWAELRIVDDGKGFRSDAPAGQGMGLRIMRYRAGLFGGQLQVGSAPNGGIQVVCRIPRSALESDRPADA